MAHVLEAHEKQEMEIENGNNHHVTAFPTSLNLEKSFIGYDTQSGYQINSYRIYSSFQ